jgi:tetratricopeptide (TPR) repeat protein
MKKIIAMILICAGSLVAVYAQEQVILTRNNISMLYRNAQKAEQAGKYDVALKIYDSILVLDAKQPVPYLKMANIYAANFDTPETIALSIAMYEKYLLLVPNNSEREVIINKITELRQKAEKETETDENLQDVVDLTAVMKDINVTTTTSMHEDENADADEDLTLDLLQDEESVDIDTEQIAEDTLMDDRQRLAYYINNGNRYYANGEYDEAIESYWEAVKIYEVADIYSALCLSYCATHNEYAAIGAYKKYIKLAPKGKDKAKLKKALAVFEPVKVDWTKIGYQPTREFWSVNYRFVPFFPIRYENQTYTGTMLHGFSIGIMSGGYSLVKAEMDFAFNYGKITNKLYPMGITSYHTWGGSGETLYNVEVKIKGKFFNEYPQFQIGEHIAGRLTGSFGGGFGHLSHTENVLIEHYTPKDDENLAHLLFYVINNLSYEFTIGTFLSKEDKPNGLKIELFATGYWQFKSQYKMTGPHFGIQIGWSFGRPE